MNDQHLDLDAIEARANTATPGPWGVYESGYVIEIAADLEETGHGYRARRVIGRLDEEPLDNDPAHREWTAEEDWAQVQADAAYIAAMPPEVAKSLLAEVRRLRASEADGWGKAIAYNERWVNADDALTTERLLTRRLRNELSRQGRAYKAEIERLKTELANASQTAVTA